MVLAACHGISPPRHQALQLRGGATKTKKSSKSKAKQMDPTGTPVVAKLLRPATALQAKYEAIAAEDTSDATDPANGGCGDFAWTHYGPILEIGGTYTNQFEGAETIDSDLWNDFAVVSYDNSLNHAVLYTPEDAEWSPNTYSKVVWLDPSWDGSVYYCTVSFDHASAEEAAAAEDSSDASDPESGGCVDFAWTKLTPQ